MYPVFGFVVRDEVAFWGDLRTALDICGVVGYDSGYCYAL
jgi:hypothetical protein